MVDTQLVHHRSAGGDILGGCYAVVSPHLDDAVLSCGLFLAANPGSSIVTAFSHGPSRVSPLPAWDAGARYFPDGADVMGVRRGEDVSSAAMAHAGVLHLGYWDGQYRTSGYGYRARPRVSCPLRSPPIWPARRGRSPGWPGSSRSASTTPTT